eukprot:scaffold29817_cov49-Prasinocladus_malaysianus.AAC.1
MHLNIIGAATGNVSHHCIRFCAHQYDLKNEEALFQRRAPGVECVDYAATGRCLVTRGTPEGKPWYKGSQWKIVSRDFVNHVFDSEQGKAWVDFFKSDFHIPDE